MALKNWRSPITFDGIVITKRRVDFVVWDGSGEPQFGVYTKSKACPSERFRGDWD